MLTFLQEELQSILRSYEHRGYFDEVLALLEAGLSLERAHASVFIFSLSCTDGSRVDGYLHRTKHIV
jgi:hypothetical protein